MKDRDSDTLREEISALLAGGLSTRTEPVPDDHLAFEAIVAELGEVPVDDLRAKLVTAGFTDHPHGEEKLCCRQCMYYLSNRRWCDLPALDLPAEPHWWCRLWRV